MDNTNYIFDMLQVVVPILAIVYWTRKEPDGMYLLFKDIHQNNLDDVKEQEFQAELIEKYREEEIN